MKKDALSDCCTPEDVPSLKGNVDDDLGALAKALGHSVRVRLMRTLIEKGTCISGDLAEEFDLAASTVSEHLRILKEAGLVQGTIDGTRRCYCVNPKTVGYFKALFTSLVG